MKSYRTLRTIPLTITVPRRDRYQGTIFSRAGWGFSPDDDRLLLTSIDNGVSTATLLDLSRASTPQRWQGAGTTSSSYVGFSPNGTYLLDAALAGTNTTNLKRL